MIFMLMLCITGLPLIFHQEIDQLTRAPELSKVASDQSEISFSGIVTKAQAVQPDWNLMFLTWDDDLPLVNAVLGPSMQAQEGDVLIIPFDTRTGERLSVPPANEGFMYFLLDLHGSLLIGLPGTLLLGFMGIIFILSVISGVVLYAPFMRRLNFATVRKNRSSRIKWLDTHNMVGIITLAWVSVVGVTGFILTMNTPITVLWQNDQLAKIAAPYANAEALNETVSSDVVLAAIFAHVPDADISFISWPGSPYATPHHFTVALRGNTPLTERLIKVAMVDAETGEVSTIEETPWYMSAMFLSIPLHFGDYGGLPLKILWALLDLGAIIVLGSGLYLWLERRNKPLSSNSEKGYAMQVPGGHR